MSESSIFAYFDAITSQRALLLTEEEALEGLTTISLETQESNEQDVLSYIENHTADFLKIISLLSNEDQELLLSYYILAKTQTSLAIIHQTTQTICSFLIRKAVERVGMHLLLGKPTPEVMAESLKKYGLENTLSAPLSNVVDVYAKCRSFQKVADLFKLHRPDVRRQMRRAASELAQVHDAKARAVGAYIHGLVEKASAAGDGLSQRKRLKLGNMVKIDSDILGQFKVSMTHPDHEQLFVSRASR